MIRIEYETTTFNGNQLRHVMFVETLEEAEEIASKIDELGYKTVDISHYIEEA